MLSVSVKDYCDKKKNLLRLPKVAEKDPDKNSTVTWSATPEARRIIDNLRNETGIPNTEILTRLMGWFVELPAGVRAAILNKSIKDRGELIRSALAELAGMTALEMKDVTETMPAQQSLNMIKALLTRVELAYESVSHELSERLKKEKDPPNSGPSPKGGSKNPK